ncbi:MAG: glycosyltransferase family 2 protein [Gemmataceae bacterium]|nr:glycosyltransferase family 2 protein [Gemmataceae bacterium]
MALAVPPGGPPPTPPPPAGVALARVTAAGPAPPGRPHKPAPKSIAPASPGHRKKAPPVAPDLRVVVVNFCQWRNTARLVRQLRRSAVVRIGSAEIVVVDNHSPDHPAGRRLERLSGVTVRRFGRNHGFAKAVNRGCRGGPGAGSRWVLLLNPDVTVPDGFLDEVLAAVDHGPGADPAIGVVGFRLLNPDGSPQASAGPFPTLPGTVAGLLRPRSRRKCRHQPLTGRQPVGWVTGGCLLVRRDCFDLLGGLDESFFLYYEDVDFCRRAAAAGWTVWYDPALEVTHHWPLHARRVPPPLRLMTRHALLTYAGKHWPLWQAGALSGLVWAEAGLRQLWAAVRCDFDAARCHGDLRRLVGDLWRSRTVTTRDRLRRAAAHLDPIAAEQDGRTA